MLAEDLLHPVVEDRTSEYLKLAKLHACRPQSHTKLMRLGNLFWAFHALARLQHGLRQHMFDERRGLFAKEYCQDHHHGT